MLYALLLLFNFLLAGVSSLVVESCVCRWMDLKIIKTIIKNLMRQLKLKRLTEMKCK